MILENNFWLHEKIFIVFVGLGTVGVKYLSAECVTGQIDDKFFSAEIGTIRIR